MIIKFKPIFLEKIWGGRFLNNLYKLGDNNSSIGECWGISGHESHSTKVLGGIYDGMTLRQLFECNRELFGFYHAKEFPFISKIIDAKDDLSIQVHPGEDYAMQHENSMGKDECWYVLECQSNSSIIIGHKAKNLEEIQNSYKSDFLKTILNTHKISVGDYFYIPSGTIHSILKGTVILEITRSSDITYRLFDYNRKVNGEYRNLDLKKSFDVINIPDSELITQNINKFFSFVVYNNIGRQVKKSHIYGDYIYILNGHGFIDSLKISKGEFLMVSSNVEYTIEGDFTFQITTIQC